MDCVFLVGYWRHICICWWLLLLGVCRQDHFLPALWPPPTNKTSMPAPALGWARRSSWPTKTGTWWAAHYHRAWHGHQEHDDIYASPGTIWPPCYPLWLHPCWSATPLARVTGLSSTSFLRLSPWGLMTHGKIFSAIQKFTYIGSGWEKIRLSFLLLTAIFPPQKFGYGRKFWNTACTSWVVDCHASEMSGGEGVEGIGSERVTGTGSQRKGRVQGEGAGQVRSSGEAKAACNSSGKEGQGRELGQGNCKGLSFGGSEVLFGMNLEVHVVPFVVKKGNIPVVMLLALM